MRVHPVRQTTLSVRVHPLRRTQLAVAALAAIQISCMNVVSPPIDPFEPLPNLAAYVPDELDRSSRDLASAVLRDDGAAVDQELARIVGLEEARAGSDQPPSGLLPYALDARNATIADERVRRIASQALLEREDLEPALRQRVGEEVEDDALALARLRLRDRWIQRYGRVANTLMESVGRSSVNATLLPFRLAQSVIGIALAEHLEAELTTPERQALAHWKRFVERHPEAPEATLLLERIREAQERWIRTRRDDAVVRAGRALEADYPGLADVHAERALRYAPGDEEASALLSRARVRVARWEMDREQASAAGDGALVSPGRQRALAVALLAPEDMTLGQAAELAREILHEGPEAPLSDEAHYVLALAAAARGVEGEFWDRIEALAATPDSRSGMARHARHEWLDPRRNPYPAFQQAVGRARGSRARALAFGPLKDGARDRRLPRWLEWVVEIPAAIGALAGLPARLLSAPFEQTPLDGPAVLARLTLERSPAGPHSSEVQRWLVDYEKARGNEVGALGLLERMPGASPEEIAALRESAALQAYEASLREKRRDVRIRLLMDASSRFAGTEGGQLAGEAAREALVGLTAQNIRISRGFLLENPKVAGPEGLALRAELFDGEPSNGELHPDGVTLLGERMLEVAMQDGRPSQPAQTRRRRISAERLSRLVAQLEEATLHTLRTDRDATVEHDADRDLFLERARLGVTDTPDLRPHAESSYAFLGMRERYGLVRSRDSILPVQLVLQGSFDDFGLGAFPRIRMPKTTPDAFLYQER